MNLSRFSQNYTNLLTILVFCGNNRVPAVAILFALNEKRIDFHKINKSLSNFANLLLIRDYQKI